MNRAESRVAVERKQRDAIFEEREQLWSLAQRGYRTGGRGLVIADGRELGPRGQVSVSWRAGQALLSCSADAQEWIRRSAESVRGYNPEREFVLQYWSPSDQVHIYRIAVHPETPWRAKAPALASAMSPPGEKEREPFPAGHAAEPLPNAHTRKARA